ncbi:LysE family translocator [Helicobacter trogontum]|uniref:LysE family translocator n=1 Tax=Helicobacter trogontum TaxID=50960 RepID=A0A4U8T5T8_9HELI|nr:LysE family translocator [Helicobacter trogontum]MCI5785828.1 LysE family translocator [Helicobacter trogontum]MDY5184374.1 LysE family translocator [Helicobacter trogontum]TLD94905.1 LysE family translocator [Helicobacter trogontum]
MSLLTLFLLAYVGAITPGPDILLVMRNTLLFGFIQGVKVFSGIASGWIVYLGVLYFGFGYFFNGKVTQIVLSIFGAVYLAYIAFMLFKKSATHIAVQDSKVSKESPDTYLKALIINLSNPKAILFFSVIVAPFIESNPLVSLSVLFCGLSSAFFSIILIATFFRNLICDKVFHIIDKVCSILFACFALLLLYHVYDVFKS